MAITFSKVADFIEAAMEGVHNLSSNTLKLALSNTAPGSESSNPLSTGNGVVANVTQIAYTNYTDDMGTDRVLENVTSDESGGTYTLDADDITITASGGAIAQFRYVYLFNDTPTSPADPLICMWDMGAAIDIADGNSITLQFNASGILTVA